MASKVKAILKEAGEHLEERLLYALRTQLGTHAPAIEKALLEDLEALEKQGLDTVVKAAESAAEPSK